MFSNTSNLLSMTHTHTHTHTRTHAHTQDGHPVSSDNDPIKRNLFF